MTRQGQGLKDKLYWRKSDTGIWHCHKRCSDAGGFQSLCGLTEISFGSLGGQDCRRPRPLLRCGMCDGKEMKRRDWVMSGPTLYPKKGERKA